MTTTQPTRTADDTNSGWFVATVVALALLAIGYIIFNRPAPSVTSAYVKIETTLGHGSATHIGGGLYVTAAHVVGTDADLKINGVASHVLWVAKDYDVALVQGPTDAADVPLLCAIPAIGTQGTAHGNPMEFDGVTTSMTVAGEARTIGHWKVALPMDGNVGPGMSGGGWIVDGQLAGVTVGAAMAPTTTGMPSYFGLAIVVPASVVCQLMGRGE